MFLVGGITGLVVHLWYTLCEGLNAFKTTNIF